MINKLSLSLVVLFLNIYAITIDQLCEKLNFDKSSLKGIKSCQWTNDFIVRRYSELSLAIPTFQPSSEFVLSTDLQGHVCGDSETTYTLDESSQIEIAFYLTFNDLGAVFQVELFNKNTISIFKKEFNTNTADWTVFKADIGLSSAETECSMKITSNMNTNSVIAVNHIYILNKNSVEEDCSSEELTTTEEPTSTTEEITTTEPSTSTTEEITTTDLTSTTEEITTTDLTSTTEEITTTEPSTSITEEITTPELTSTTEEITTTEPTSTTEEFTTTDLTSTTEEITTTDLTSTTEEITTTEPSTSTTEEITTTEPSTSTTEEITTTEPSTSPTEDITTTEPSISTTQEITTTDLTSTTEETTITDLTSTTEEITTTDLTSTSGEITTTDLTSTTEEITTTDLTSTTEEITTTDRTVSTTDGITTTTDTTTTDETTIADQTTETTNVPEIPAGNSYLWLILGTIFIVLIFGLITTILYMYVLFAIKNRKHKYSEREVKVEIPRLTVNITEYGPWIHGTNNNV